MKWAKTYRFVVVVVVFVEVVGINVEDREKGVAEARGANMWFPSIAAA